jgi:multimeric flavodoxin WrbA
MPVTITACAINCSLAPSGKRESSTDAMIAVLREAFAEHDVTVGDPIRIADHDVKPGVTSDEGEGDAWPRIRAQILDADILVFGTPIWMGQACSIAKRVLERMDAFLSETDDQGRMPSYGKVAVAAIVGNEDGAHWASSQLFQSLNDTGLDNPCGVGVLLGGGSHAGHRFQGSREDAREGRQDSEDGREQCRTPCQTAQGQALSRLKNDLSDKLAPRHRLEPLPPA